MVSIRLVAVLFVVALLGYVGLARATFEVPASAADAEACGLTPEDLAAMGGDSGPSLTRTWLTSFVRKQEYWSALSVGLAVAFGGFALLAGRQLGAGVASGAAAGSGALALGALCLSCLAPTLSVVGVGLLGAVLAPVPKWSVTLATAALTGGGAFILSRRLRACPLPGPARSAANARHAGD